MAANETLVEWLSGDGQVRRRDGTVIGTRHYDIEVWRPAGADAPHDGSVGGGRTSVKAAIDFSDAERRELASTGMELVLILEDGRQFEFAVHNSGAIVSHQGGPARPRVRRGLGVTAAVVLAGVIYLLGQTAVGAAVWSWVFRTPYALPATLGALALLVIMIGLQTAPRSRDPGGFRFGVVMFAIGLVLMYALPVSALAIVKQMGGPDELGGILALFAFLGGAGAFLGGGLSSIANSW